MWSQPAHRPEPLWERICQINNLGLQIQGNRQIIDQILPGPTYSLGTGYKEAGIYGKDDRIKVNHLTYPFRTIGKLVTIVQLTDKNCKQSVTTGSCTATLVGQCHLLTAQHCVAVVKGTAELFPPGTKVKFGTSIFIDALGTMHLISKRVTGQGSKGDQNYAFLKIDGRPGQTLGFAPFLRKSFGSFKNGTVFTAAGFSSDVDPGKYLTADKTATKVTSSYNQKILKLRFDDYGGASGGPIFAKADNGVPYIAAIISRGPAFVSSSTGQESQTHLSDDEKKLLTVNVTTESFAKDLRKFIRSNPCSP